MTETTFNRATRSLCPVCLRAIDGRIVSRGKAVYLEKSCPEHGPMESRIWPDADHYDVDAGRFICPWCGRRLRENLSVIAPGAAASVPAT